MPLPSPAPTRQARPWTAGLRALAMVGFAVLASQGALQAFDQALEASRGDPAGLGARSASARLRALDPLPDSEVALSGRRGPPTAHPLFDDARGASPESPRPNAALGARPACLSTRRLLRQRERRPPECRRSPLPEAGLIAHLPQGPPSPGRSLASPS